MSEKTNLKKLDYQERVLNSNEKFICEDWERGTGKTTTLLRKVLKPNTSVLWVTSTLDQFRIIKYAIEDLGYSYKMDNNNKRLMTVILNEGICRIYNGTYSSDDNDDSFYFSRGYKVDNIVIDDINIKFTYNFKERMDHLFKNVLKDKNGQIINLYTSVKNYIKSESKHDKFKPITKKVLCSDNIDYTKVVMEELSNKIKPNTKIFITDYNSFSFSYLLSSINDENLQLIGTNKAIYRFNDNEIATIYFVDLKNEIPSVRGHYWTDLLVLGLDVTDDKIGATYGEVLKPFMLPNANTVTNIYIEEQKTDRYKILDDQIDILLEELDNTQKSSNTTMTREKIINMIDRLYKIKELEK